MSSPVCPVCRGREFDVCASNPHHTINCGKVQFVKNITNAVCRACGQVQNHPMMSDEELSEIYKAMTRNVVEGVVTDYSSLPIEHAQYDFVAKHAMLPHNATVLDIGCSLGGFLQLFADTGAHVVGCEPSESDGRIAAAKGIQIVPKMFAANDYIPHSFDLIALRFVFEHLRDPSAMLGNLRTLLKPGGVVFIEVPDLAHPFVGLDDYFSFGHTFTFSRETLRQAAEAGGYTVLALDECDNSDLPRRTFPSLRMLITPGSGALPIHGFAPRSHELVQNYLKTRTALIAAIGQRLAHRATGEKSRLVIYGAGTHSAELLAVFPWLLDHCIAFVDGNRDLQGHLYFDRPVLAPGHLPQQAPDFIIISAREAEREILAYLDSLGMADRAVTLYT